MSTGAAAQPLVPRPGSGPAAPPARRESPRRSRLVDAGIAVLGRQGCASTSVKEIARQAGVAPGLLHYYFDSKDDLLAAVVDELDTQLIGTWSRSLVGIEDPLERIVAGLSALEAHFARRPELWRLLFDLDALCLSTPALRQRCQALRGHLVGALETEVRQALGRLPAYTLAPPADLAGTLAASVEGVTMAALVEGRDPSAHFRALKVMVLSMVVTAHVTAGQPPPIARLSELLEPR